MPTSRDAMDRQPMTDRSSEGTRRGTMRQGPMAENLGGYDGRAVDAALAEQTQRPHHNASPAYTPGRRHMGTATSDPQYLPPIEQTRDGVRGPAHIPAPPDQRAPLHYDRYIEKPKQGKTIFTSRYERSRRRTRAVLLVLLVIVVVALALWFIFLR